MISIFWPLAQVTFSRLPSFMGTVRFLIRLFLLIRCKWSLSEYILTAKITNSRISPVWLFDFSIDLDVALTLASTIIVLGSLLFELPCQLIWLVQFGLFFGCLFCFLLSGIVHVESGVGILIILIPQLPILYDINPRYLQIERVHVDVEMLNVFDEGLQE